MTPSRSENERPSNLDAVKRELTGKKVALVLAGGGFKGSYQIGVWKALREMGINRFISIAGTSAGALNAIMIAADNLTAAENIWCEKKMMTWSVKSWGAYLFAYTLLLTPFLLGFMSYGAIISALVDNHLGPVFPVCFLLLGIANNVALYDRLNAEAQMNNVYYPFTLRFWRPFLGAVLLVGAFAAIGLWLDSILVRGVFSATAHALWAFAIATLLTWYSIGTLEPHETKSILHLIPARLLTTVCGGTARAVIVAAIYYEITVILTNARMPAAGRYLSQQDMLPPHFVPFGIIFIGGTIGAFSAGKAFGRRLTMLFGSAQKDGQLFSNGEILATIKEQLDFGKIAARVGSLFVTVARSRTFLDPFNRKIDYVDKTGSLKFDQAKPDISTSWVPEYSDIGKITEKAQAIELFRLTSALPMIFKMGASPQGEMLVDGGLVDNVPIVPALDAGAEAVLVLLLDERGLNSFEVKAHINRTWRLWRTPDLSELDATEIYATWIDRKGVFIMDDDEYGALKESGNTPLRRALNLGGDPFIIRETDYAQYLPKPFEKRERTIIVLAPQEPLCVSTFGPLRFITGTLNFLLRFRRRWLKYGYEETLGALRGEGARRANLTVIHLHAKKSLE
jgi:predicted acylesterase/phospholipase RssA